MCRLVLILLFTIFPHESLARLGEDEQQNEERYGVPVQNVNDELQPILIKSVNKTYHYQGWKIRIGYLNDRAVRLRYTKLPTSGWSPVLKQDEIAAILKGETHGGNWSKLGGGRLFRKQTGNKNFDQAQNRWVNSLNFIAYTPMGSMSLFVESPEATVWENALDQHKENKRKEGIPKF